MNWILIIAAICQPLTGTDTRTSSWIAPRIDIVGSGFNGTDATGPILQFAQGVRDGIVLGAGDPFRATGSRIERVRVARLGSGGVGIKIVALDEGQRPGEISIRDVLVCGMSDLRGGNPDNWDTALLIDGGPLTAVNAAGVRRIRIDKFRAASCLSDSIIFRNVTHLCGTDIQVDRGTAHGTMPTLIIENSTHVFLDGLNVFGEVHLRGKCSVIQIRGYAQAIYIGAECSQVNFSGSADKVVVSGKPPLSRVTRWERW
jgi:hypothetical protein